ncbi:hypothetical protein KKA09_02675 [Patescibacteria group bacterium]|nr:hypothetical protein [Patescibacteria group bacterium]
MKDYYHNLITEKSFKILQEIKREFDFILIGGWAVWLYTKALKSKDIDLICEYNVLEKFKEKFNLTKNERLKKYEIKIEEIDIDIYLPFYSELGLPVEDIKKYTFSLEGLVAPKPEILLILKQVAFEQRKNSIKGEKDKIDIISLLSNLDLDFAFYKKMLKKYGQKNFQKGLVDLIREFTENKELGINKHKYSKFKKRILEKLSEL